VGCDEGMVLGEVVALGCSVSEGAKDGIVLGHTEDTQISIWLISMRLPFATLSGVNSVGVSRMALYSGHVHRFAPRPAFKFTAVMWYWPSSMLKLKATISSTSSTNTETVSRESTTVQLIRSANNDD